MYVWRNDEGKIVGAFLNLQPGYAEEWLELDNPELVEFFNPVAQ